jgi:opacity protein-like surface antigen
MLQRLLAAALVVAFSWSVAFAVGEAGVPSQIIPPGARANGMGESFVAIADDATAAWFNPGGVAFLKGRNLALMHSQLVPDLASDVYYEYLGYSNEIRGVGTLSIGVIYLTYGSSVATNAEGLKIGDFKSWEASGVVTFAIPLTENLGVGLSGKYIHADYAPADLTLEKLDGTGSSVAIDAGVLWKIARYKLNLGAALTNLGPDISFIDQEQSDPLPINLRIGAAYTPISSEINNLLMTFDIEQSLVWLIDNDVDTRRSEIYHVGAEYKYINLIAGRLGYVYDDDGDFSAPTYGLGFIYKEKVALDYANVPQATTLDRVHRWSVSVSF